jgi:small-conductance mechanosensitive channel
LLPLLRHAVLIVIFVVGIIAVLERLGFNIGPLLAGLGSALARTTWCATSSPAFSS